MTARASYISPRRGARVVEWDGLENRCTGNRTVGSNPTLSAIKSLSGSVRANQLEPGCSIPLLAAMQNPFRYFNSSPAIIRLAVMMYVRFPLSLRQVEDLLSERGIDICHETVRFWWNRFGPGRQDPAEIRRRPRLDPQSL